MAAATVSRDIARACASALDSALRAAAVEPELNRTPSLRTAFWPSDLLMCRRRTGLAFLEVERDQPHPRVVESRTWGRLYHDEYYRRLASLEDKGFRVLATEQPVTIHVPGVGLPIRGRYDALVEATGEAIAALGNGALPGELQPGDTVRFLVDIKSVTSYAVREVAATGRPSPQDAAEMTCYLHHTRLPFGIVLYHDKQTAIREPVPVTYDPELWEHIQGWIRSVYEHVREGKVPPRDHDPDTTEFPCGYCPFRTACLTLGPGAGTAPAPPEQLPIAALTPEGQLRTRAQELLDRIITTEARAKELLESTAPLRRELEQIVRQLGRIDTRLGSATINTTTEWDTDVLRARLAELGALDRVLDISTARVRELISAGELPASLLAEARRTVDRGLRVTPARRDRNGSTA